MKLNRRNFLKLSAATAGVAILGGGVSYALHKDPDPLADFYTSTETVLGMRFGQNRAETLVQDIRQVYVGLLPKAPYIGGEANIFTEWLTYGVYYLAVYQVLKSLGQTVEQAGRMIYETYETMADYPAWMLRLVGSFKYGKGYVERLRIAAVESQQRRYPDDWVCTFVEGDGETFDYGLDITECGICKFYHAQGAGELTPYMCLSDYVVGRAFGRGLVRYKTIAEGAQVCDFRYKQGRETFVHPLRDGWPPKFIGGGI
ncbi:MAG: L-2-amino-thiazoline-4-carboxylic acid hydrolase [Anaerolineae bacterium]|nr:L-2-amino-thiazoline-4-carboxylic acid hydrolase [Anaerolineae bacterium]